MVRERLRLGRRAATEREYGVEPHPVVTALLERARSGSQPGRRTDGHRIALVVEGGAMRGVVSGGMVAGLEALGLRDAFDVVYGSLGWVAGIILAIMTLSVFLSVVTRWIGSQALEGLDELPRYLFVWLVAVGGAAAMHRNEHTVLDYFVNRFGPTGRAVMSIISNVLMIAVFLFLIHLSITLVPNAALQSSPSLGLRLDYVFAAVPFGAAMILPPIFRNVWRGFALLGPTARLVLGLPLAVVIAWLLFYPGSTDVVRSVVLGLFPNLNMAVALLILFG